MLNRKESSDFGPALYGPKGGFASIVSCPSCLALRELEASVSSAVDRVLSEGLEETRAAISERLSSGGLAVPGERRGKR